MNAKVIITLILGLVFQLAQVLPGAIIPASCAPHSQTCGCCAEGKSCQCSIENEPDHQQAPKPALPDAQGVLKAPLVRPGDEEAFVHPVTETLASAIIESTPRRESPAGFAGVRLSVAFCSIVI